MRTRALLLVVAVVACSGEPVVDAAGHDGGAIDVGRDVGLADTGSADVGADAADARPDAYPFGDPEWVRIPGNPDDCYLEYAAHPERVLQLDWRSSSCPPAVPTCTMASIYPRGFAVLGYEGVWDAAGHRWLFQVATQGFTGIDAIVGSDGAVIAAVRNVTTEPPPVHCEIYIVPGPTTIAMRGTFFRATAPIPLPMHLARGPFADWFNHPLPLGELATLPYPTSPQEFLSSDTATVNKIVPREYLLVSRSGAPTARHTPGFASVHSIIGDHVFWSSYSDDGGYTTRVYHSGASDTDDLLLDGVAAQQDYLDFTANAHDMAWYVVTARTPTGTINGGNLMTAPFATTAADLHPRVLHAGCAGGAECTAPRIGPDAIASSYVTEAPDYRHTLDLYSLADGSRSRIVLPTTMPRYWGFNSPPAWVDANEVAIAASVGGTNTLVRFPRSAFTPAP